MARANALRALPPVWFRFTDEADKDRYGSGWLKYDEGAILRRPARDLIGLETDLGFPIVAVMNGFRDSTVLGETAVAWIALRETFPDKAGEFDDFSPITMMIEWTPDNPEPEGKEGEREITPEQADSVSQTDSGSQNTSLGKTDTVALPIMPISESAT